MPCILCQNPTTRPIEDVGGRRYLECTCCRLTFVHPADRLDPDEERARYATHQNSPDDPRYRAFLDRLAVPLIERLTPGMKGLDFGSGPGPTLSRMLSERGFPTVDYDPFFAADDTVLSQTWDFVTCTETAEHFYHPGVEFQRLVGLLKRPGWLAVMTQVLDDGIDLATWWYLRDPTHVAFYRPDTLEWIAHRYDLTLERPAPSVALFLRPGTVAE